MGFRGMGDRGYSRSLGSANQGFVEGEKRCAGRAACEVDGIGDLEALSDQGESVKDVARVLRHDVRGVEELLESVTNHCLVKTVIFAELPGSFEQYGLRDPDGADSKGRLNRFELGWVVGNEEANEEVSIDRCHIFASPHDPLPP